MARLFLSEVESEMRRMSLICLVAVVSASLAACASNPREPARVDYRSFGKWIVFLVLLIGAFPAPREHELRLRLYRPDQ